MPLFMDYVIDCNEQDEFEVKYKGDVIGKDQFHNNAVSIIVSHIAGRCERAETRVVELEQGDKDHLNSWTALMRELAKLSDALGLDDGDWREADDSTLVEQFDPWTVVTAAIEKSKKALPETELRCAICALNGGQHAPDCPLYSWPCGLCGALVSKRTQGDHAKSHAALPLSTSNACLCGDWPKQSTWLHCPWCGCTLSAAQQAVCPECGFAHAPGGNTCCDR